MNEDIFFAQSYEDALNDYVYSCENTKSEKWDWIILTAANEKQADVYRLQIDRRNKEKRLPMGTKFAVIPDYENKRIGSGGATLNVIRYISEKIGCEALLQQKILVIHSGGDSKRIPQYSACGKLFAPVPRMLPSGYVSTIFDELLIAATDIPNRCGKGMMVFPSDTEMLFNSLQLDLLSCDAAGLSIKAPVNEGQDHGVFLQGNDSFDHRNRNVSRFLHKQSEKVLKSCGAVDSSNQVDIDTGCIWFSDKIVKALWELISKDGEFDKNQFDKFVNSIVCLNFYADFVYPLAEDSTLDEFYKETPENGYSDELKICRKIIWEKLHPYKLSLVKIVPARYIHFGMTHEMYDLFVNDIHRYKYLGWQNTLVTNAENGTVINSYIVKESFIPDSVYIEDSIVNQSQIGERVILSNVDLQNVVVPDDVVLHGLKLKNGKYVCRIYGKDDNPKSSSGARFLNSSIDKLVENTGVTPDAIWGKKTASIWNAKIYPACDTLDQAVLSALNIYRIIQGVASISDIEEWRKSEKYSLCSSFYEADVPDIIDRQILIKNKVKIELLVKELNNGSDISKTLCKLNEDAATVIEYIKEIAGVANTSKFPQNMRLFLAIADICRKYGIDTEQHNFAKYENLAYDVVQSTITHETFSRFGMKFPQFKVLHETVTIELPVRVNFCGSPSDAAPYCLEHGGTMIDGALLLKGKKPIKVTVNKIKEKEIRFGSIDQGCSEVFHQIEEVRECNDPFDPYALHKAVLVATGLIPYDISEITMERLCDEMGGGIELLTAVDVPKGSGLGTSSIIAAAAVKAVNEICGVEVSNEMIYAQVFLVEQLMTTGGGWQDQVGGLTNGIKYFTALPGSYQKIEVEQLSVSRNTMKELNERFALIFSGQRRLARNVLREEMNQCIRNNEEALEAVRSIQEYCAIMRYYLMKGDITSFAKYISKQFELVKKLDKGASNTCIEYIFDVCEDLIDGKSICGAGGGGFLQVILKEGVTKEMLNQRIQEVFIDCGVEVWDCELI